LFSYIYSQRPPSTSYPYGYGKFETLGTTVVSLFLLLGAFAIGTHSYNLLAPSLPFLAAIPTHSHSHGHSHDDELDPNAAWFALLSIITKEYLYRLTASVAKQENSPVLLANALHHRSDMYSSFVSLVAILGSWAMPKLPLDPIGGPISPYLNTGRISN
jgi:cation diffusion facilitator family transporter